MRDLFKLVLVLTLICAGTAGTLQILQTQLSPQIEMQVDLFIRGPALNRLFSQPAQELLKHKILYHRGNDQIPIFYILDNQNFKKLGIERIGKGGYGGDVLVMIGVDLQSRKLIGLEIIQHSETPGVGSRIENITFRKQWKNISIDKTVELRSTGGQIDGISGATYSSQAVINATNGIIKLLQDNEKEILSFIENDSNRKNIH